jgi:nitrogen fixation NifU-like protein
VSDLSELYQEVVLEHSAHPRNFGALPGPCRTAQGVNPLCGDKLSLSVRVEDGKVAEIRFVGDGCAISRASTSLMTEAVKGKTVEETQRLFARMHRLFTQGDAAGDAAEATDGLGKLRALSGVWEYPSRVKCASLAWHTLRAALAQEQPGQSTAPVQTEQET